MSTKPEKVTVESVEAQRKLVEKRLKDLAVQVPPVRTDLKVLRSNLKEIAALRTKCLAFVEGQHPQLEKLANEAAVESLKQAEQVNHMNTDLRRAVEIAELFVAARAEAWLRCEAVIVGPACEWADVASGLTGHFEQRMERLREWHKLKSPRWTPT